MEHKMNKSALIKLQKRLKRRVINASYMEMHRSSMRKAYEGMNDTVKMHEFRGGRTVSVAKFDGAHYLVCWNGNEHAFIENRFDSAEKAVAFATTLWGNIGWNIK